MKRKALLACLVLSGYFSFSQEWKLQLSSNVELRTWKLTTKADKSETPLGGAAIILTKGGATVAQTTSDGNGDFTIEVPANDDFVLTVSYGSCNAKKFAISTRGVPDNVAKDNFHPTYSIGGFIMAKPFPGIDYSGLKQELVKVVYFDKGQKFDDDESATEKGQGIVSKIADAENTLIEKFCSTNKAGDVALAKPDCPLAKKLYEQAIALIPGEPYPVEQLAKVGECLKVQEAAAKKAQEESAAKEAVAKAEAEKTAAAKAEKEQTTAAEKAAKEKAASEKAEAQKLAKEKATAEKTAQKLAKEKAAAEKSNTGKQQQAATAATPVQTDQADKKQTTPDRQPTKNTAFKEKQLSDKAAADAAKKAEKQKDKAEKLAKQKEGMERSKAEDEAAMKADYEKHKSKQEAKKKEDAEREAERTAKDKEKKKLAYETATKDGDGSQSKGNSKYSTPQVLGADRYKQIIAKAEDYFKTKRYTEAKVQYQEALQVKPSDPLATKRLAEIEKLTAPK